MTQIVSTTPGLYPLPEWAKDDLARSKGHQKEDLVPVEDPEVAEVYERARAEVVEAQQDAAGVDLVADHEANSYVINEYGCTDDVALGVVDGQNTLVESPEEVGERVEWVLSNTPGADFETVYATVNAPTFYLPSSKFAEKLDVLGAVERTEVTA